MVDSLFLWPQWIWKVQQGEEDLQIVVYLKILMSSESWKAFITFIIKDNAINYYNEVEVYSESD